MLDLKDLESLWLAHERRRFPLGIRGKKFNDVDLTQVESLIARYIIAKIELKGQVLSKRICMIVATQLEALDKALPMLSEDGKSYFLELKSVAQHVIA